MRIFLVIFFLSAFGVKSLAFEIQRQNDRLNLKGSCKEVSEIAESLAKWTLNTGEDKTCPIGSFKPKSGLLSWSDCNFDITDCVPNHVLKYEGVRSKNEGPNCWNLALVMKGVLPALRYSTPEEITFFLNSPLCRQLKHGEDRLPGDVGALRVVKEGQEVEHHGFIYISDKISYSKNGASVTSPYKLQSLEKVYRVYHVGKAEECRSNEINIRSESCGAVTTYYRCSSPKDFINENSETRKELSSVVRNLDVVESCVHDRVFRGLKVPTLTENIGDITKILATYLDDQMTKVDPLNPFDEEKSFFVVALQLRLSALLQQLDLAGEKIDALSVERYGSLSQAVKKFVNIKSLKNNK